MVRDHLKYTNQVSGLFCRKTEVDEDADSGPEVSLCDEPARFHRQKGGETKAKPSASSQSRAPKRPDQPLYMPRAARQRLSLQNSPGPAENHESQSSACGGVSLGGLPQAGDRHKAAAESDADASGNNSASCPEEKRKPSQLSLREDLVLEQTQSCLSELSLEQGEDAESSDLTREADHLTKLVSSDSSFRVQGIQKTKIGFFCYIFPMLPVWCSPPVSRTGGRTGGNQ